MIDTKLQVLRCIDKTNNSGQIRNSFLPHPLYKCNILHCPISLANMFPFFLHHSLCAYKEDGRAEKWKRDNEGKDEEEGRRELL